MELWYEGLFALGGVVLMAIVGMVREWLRKRKIRRRLTGRRTLAGELREFSKVLLQLEQVQQSVGTTCVRTRLWLAHNDGGIIEIGRPLYATPLLESLRDDAIARVGEIRPADRQQVYMLRQLVETGRVHYTTAGMPTGWLREEFREDGITFAAFSRVLVDDRDLAAIWYASVEVDGASALNIEDLEHLREAVVEMRKILLTLHDQQEF